MPRMLTSWGSRVAVWQGFLPCWMLGWSFRAVVIEEVPRGFCFLREERWWMGGGTSRQVSQLLKTGAPKAPHTSASANASA
jgi:hypothetical protein